VVALSNNNGILTERYEYDVFGQPTIYDANGDEITDSNVGNPYMFTGRRIDTETGLYYYRARYYDQYVGRFFFEKLRPFFKICFPHNFLRKSWQNAPTFSRR